MADKGNVFYVAPFTPDGKLLGVRKWKVKRLSPKWLGVCESILEQHGSTFRISMGQMLDHLEIKLTSSSGAGLGTFYAHGEIALSAAYFRGEKEETENDVMRMFVDSMRKIDIVQQMKKTETPFEKIFSIKKRPLAVVVIWANSNISDQDYQLINELFNHFAGAYLTKYTD
ncbi:MAG: hypothetical protein GTO45_16775 [Candidatus Aminicenantes bacterium]|nr:hypothetical protein [Candidatus Aminicenantes bacterium]NIM80396.1 hypothetical protein [Candidatus Aminicenantes bacterium]NIN19783.1 hypothetical protein [Candidatus Aminicenantes bacterium]NIN43665.1 hypothetical protein [Candidatus Aminicenantes bacterium]NIN86410.1 hypothetical protein [Candidatus Aminicenantes bacterium]